MTIIVGYVRGGVIIVETTAAAAQAVNTLIAEAITQGAAYFNHVQDAKALADQLTAWNNGDFLEMTKVISSAAFGAAVTIALIETGVGVAAVGAAAVAAGIVLSPAVIATVAVVGVAAAGYYAGEYFNYAFDQLVRSGQVIGGMTYEYMHPEVEGDVDIFTIADIDYDIMGNVNSNFTAARNVVVRRDPLVLDLDGDGLELSSASGNTLFDHNADGIKTGTGWARPDDGFLVRDLNGNGTIDTGRELFGVDTIKSNGALATQGFDALKDLDSNNDGFITSADAAFGELKVWQDTNQDGISQSGELKTLTQLNITSIGVNGSTSGPQAGQAINNNIVALSATYTRNGVTRTVGAIDLEANNFFTEFPPEVVDEAGNPVPITTQAQALPQMNGSGMVRNLRAAASLSSGFSITNAAANEFDWAISA